MNHIKLKIASLKKGILRRIRKKRAAARGKMTALGRRIASLLRMRMILRRRQQRAEPARGDDATEVGGNSLAQVSRAESLPCIPSLTLPSHTPSSTTSPSPPTTSPSLISCDSYSSGEDDGSVYMSDVFQDYSGDEEDNNSDDDEVDDGWSWETEDTDEDDDSSDDDEEIETEEGVGPAIFAKKTTSFGGAVTLEEDETDHDDILQCGEDMLESAVQQCNYRDGPALSRTSSEEELAAIFGDKDAQPSVPLPFSPPPPSQAQLPTQGFSTETELTSECNDAGLYVNYGFQHSGSHSAFSTQQEPTISHHMGAFPAEPPSGYFSFSIQPLSEPLDGAYFTQVLPVGNLCPHVTSADPLWGQYPILPATEPIFYSGSAATSYPDLQQNPSVPIINDSGEAPVITELDAALPPLAPDQPESTSRDSKLPPIQLTPPSSRGRRPAPLILSLGDDKPPSPPLPPPPGPSTAERMWTEYAANRCTSPEYFLYPPFTPEQEQWIVQVGHPFKDYVLQTWQDQIHSSVQDSLRVNMVD
jgi:hypothetical protein